MLWINNHKIIAIKTFSVTLIWMRNYTPRLINWFYFFPRQTNPLIPPDAREIVEGSNNVIVTNQASSNGSIVFANRFQEDCGDDAMAG